MSAEITEKVHLMGRQARAAAYELASLTTEQKDAILIAMAAGLRQGASKILV